MNVPKKYDRCKITWGIFLKGKTIFRPQTVQDHLCASSGHKVNMCMIREHAFVYDI